MTNTLTLDKIIESIDPPCSRDCLANFCSHRLGEIANERLRQQFLQWVADTLIGENINWNYSERMQYSTREADALDYMFAVNSTKDEQRQILKAAGWKERV